MHAEISEIWFFAIIRIYISSVRMNFKNDDYNKLQFCNSKIPKY